MTDIVYESKKAWAIDYDIYCGYSNITAAQIEYYTEQIKEVLTADGNFAHVEIDGDEKLITIWGDDKVEDINSFNQLLTELTSLGAIVEKPEDEEEDKACATIVADTLPRRVKTVYRKAVVYVRADIEYTDEADLKKQLEELEINVSLDLDNAPSGNYDYEFTYDGLSDIKAEEVPDWLFE